MELNKQPPTKKARKNEQPICATDVNSSILAIHYPLKKNCRQLQFSDSESSEDEELENEDGNETKASYLSLQMRTIFNEWARLLKMFNAITLPEQLVNSQLTKGILLNILSETYSPKIINVDHLDLFTVNYQKNELQSLRQQLGAGITVKIIFAKNTSIAANKKGQKGATTAKQIRDPISSDYTCNFVTLNEETQIKYTCLLVFLSKTLNIDQIVFINMPHHLRGMFNEKNVYVNLMDVLKFPFFHYY